MIQIGNRVPRTFFTTTGVGESDVTIHAGSYHLALRDAGIEMANIVTYSSILPGTCSEVPHPDMSGPDIVHGEVMESICAVSHVGPGHRATAAIIYGWLIDPRDGSQYGGLVCEYGGSMIEDDVKPHLVDMIRELHENGYEDWILSDLHFLVSTFVPVKAYGTALAAICFTSYDVPVLGGQA